MGDESGSTKSDSRPLPNPPSLLANRRSSRNTLACDSPKKRNSILAASRGLQCSRTNRRDFVARALKSASMRYHPPLSRVASIAASPACVTRPKPGLRGSSLICSYFSVGSDFRNKFILVPHSGQVPFACRRPLSLVITCGSFIVRLSLHFTQ